MTTVEPEKLVQGSKEWLDFRANKLGASDLPIIMGKSKWSTPYVLWRRKLGLDQEQKENWAMKRGTRLEPEILATINAEDGTEFAPTVRAHHELEWAIASLDGWDESSQVVLEIKTAGKEDHDTAKAGRVPDHYWHQVQWQLFVCGVEKALYVSYHNGDLARVNVVFDSVEMTEETLPTAADFYHHMISGTEPAKSEKDYVEILDPLFEQYGNEYFAASEMAALYQDKEKFFKKKMTDMSDEGNSRGFGFATYRVNRDGAIDWKSLYADIVKLHPDLKEEFPPDQYRKESIGYWKVRREK